MIEKVYAQVGTSVESTLSTDFQNFGDLFGFFINVILGVGWALVFIMLALGFVQYVMSRGEKTAVDSAQKWLTYAVIGGVGLFFVSFLRGAIQRLISSNPNDGPLKQNTEFDFGQQS